MRRAIASLLIVAACLAAASAAGAAPPPIRHVFIIVLENKNYDSTFGPNSQAPYLSKTLTAKGQLLTQYYGIGHFSLDNYIAMVSGQSPNPQTQSDCQFYTEFTPGTIGADGQALGSGCVYPAAVKTIADQLEAKNLTWKGYMEDMKTPCRHPAIGAHDETQTAKPGDQYAARHNPFVYFHSIIDRPACAQNDVPIEALPNDLKSASSTPNYVFITPNLCHDGHDTPCVDNQPGGLVSSDEFLRTWVPKILQSPAYKQDGLLIVTFDESESGAEDCCNEPHGPNTPNNGGTTQGNGGGRTGTVLLSPFIRAGVVNDTPYNHYALLRSVEDIFGLGHLGYAGRSDLKAFGDDVYNAGSVGGNMVGRPSIRITPRVRRCARRDFKASVSIRAGVVRRVNAMVDRRRVKHTRRTRFSVRVHIRGLRNGRHRLTVRVSQRNGPTGRRTAVFRVCR